MDKYEKIRVVGKGAYGIVYLCRRLSDNKQVILKEICVDHLTKDEIDMSMTEARVLSMLDHPNIVAYYENFIEDKSLYIVMEYASGGNLAEYLQQRNDRLLSEEEVLHFFAQLVLALQHIHTHKILHRDLKSQNILLDKKRDVLKITDFGIAKILGTNSKALTVVGTPYYISPELCEGKQYDHKSDVWSLGCVLYELLTLKRPFEAETLPALVQKIMTGSFQPAKFDDYSSSLRELLLSLLHLDPARRPTLPQIMAHPVVIAPLFKLYSHIGCVTVKTTRSHRLPSLTSSSQISTSSVRSSIVETGFDMSACQLSTNSLSKQQVFCWNPPENPLISLSQKELEFQAVSIGQTYRCGLSRSGRALLWKDGPDGENQCAQCFPDDKLGVSIAQVACGADFQAFLTSRGILMTFGKGQSGSLGHGDYKDVLQPKIVEAILGTDVCQISCGPQHIMALTAQGILFAWGQGSNSRLGLGKSESFCSPQAVQFPKKHTPQIQSITCGWDCSFLVTQDYKLLACGSNRHNKLAMDTEDGCSVEESPLFTLVRSQPLDTLPIKAVASYQKHTAVLTGCGHLYTVGSNQCGQLGWGRVGTTHNMPGKVEDLNEDAFSYVACGMNFTAASSVHSGHLYVWGFKDKGNDSSASQPNKVQFPRKSRYKVQCLAASGSSILAAVTTQSR